MHPKVSIIIPCFNEEVYIQKNVESILAQNYEGEIEILVVDGMSTDETRSILEQYGQKVLIIDNPERFTPQALNKGIKNATGEIFIILGGHAYLDASFVRLNVEHLVQKEDVGCVGGQIININENEWGEIISKAMSSSFGVGNATFRTGGEAQYVDTVAFGAYKKEIVDKIGYFDEDLVRNQDDEYNFRLTKSGKKIYFDPAIKSFYFVRGSLDKLYSQYKQYGYWKVYVNKKHNAITTLRQLIPLFFVLGVILGVVLSPFSWVIASLFSGVMTLYVLFAWIEGLRKSDNFMISLKMILVFFMLHWSYGWGYLTGIIDFILLNKKPSKRSTSSTR